MYASIVEYYTMYCIYIILFCYILRILHSSNSGSTLAVFKHHTAPITSVEWHPTDSTVFASSGEDDQVGVAACGEGVWLHS